MSEHYRFFDSIDGEDERFYTADEFAEYFRKLIGNGVFNGGGNLRVSTDSADMSINIKEGYAWLEGYLYKIDTEPLSLTFDVADPVLNRIDRVVIRLDKTLNNRYVKAFILKGTPAENPIAPILTRNENIYEISLGKVEILAGKSFIENYQITDERLNNEVCGLVTHLFDQVDTSQIFNEWENYLIYKKNQSNLSYEDFTNELQLKLNLFQESWNSWTDNKILEPNGEFYAQWKNWFNEVQNITNLVTKTEFEGHIENKELHLPKGLIAMWSGLINKIPGGWALCNGENGTPDLRDRFIVGAGEEYLIGDIGGDKEVTLSINELPSHGHNSGSLVTDSNGNHSHSGSTSTSGSHTHNYYRQGVDNYQGKGTSTGVAQVLNTLATDSGGSHSHSISINSAGSHNHSISGTTANSGSGGGHENRPPYYALAFIIKL